MAVQYASCILFKPLSFDFLLGFSILGTDYFNVAYKKIRDI
jgi:hypothetical protein